MIKFGPSGNEQQFYESGHKSSAEAPKWLSEIGLSAYEYSFGRGVRMGKQMANALRDQARQFGISVSVHAPYYINLNVSDEERRGKNYKYFIETALAAREMGAGRMIFHPGSVSDAQRGDALRTARLFLKEIIARLDDEGLGDITLCPETMGKIQQLGDLREVIALCELDERLLPCIDFGHLNARTHGGLKTPEDFNNVLEHIKAELGVDRLSKMHSHFSRIEYTAGGEKKHHNFSDVEFGPEFGMLAGCIAGENYDMTIICESRSMMATDALAMKKMVNSLEKTV